MTHPRQPVPHAAALEPAVCVGTAGGELVVAKAEHDGHVVVVPIIGGAVATEELDDRLGVESARSAT